LDGPPVVDRRAFRWFSAEALAEFEVERVDELASVALVAATGPAEGSFLRVHRAAVRPFALPRALFGRVGQESLLLGCEGQFRHVHRPFWQGVYYLYLLE